MSPALHSVQFFLLAAVAFLALGSLLSAVGARAFAARLSRWEPRARHRALVLLAVLPVLTALALMLSASLPSLLSLVVPELDHCATHDDGHAHLCFVHLPGSGIHLAWVLGLVFLVSYASLRVALGASDVVRAVRVLGALTRTGEPRRDLGVIVLETSRPVCLTAGLWRPRVLLSRGLLDSLGEEERAVVLAHERAHVRRRDALVASLVRALAVVHLPRVARWLVRELEIAAEQACDEDAARAVGDRVAVASAILSVERATRHAVAERLVPVAVAFGQCAVARRVESLLAEPVPTRSLRGVALGLVAALMGVLGTSATLHHLTESLLSVVAH
ncbi:M56 family metallopeptidase [Cystobacter fuscus]|uniref:M56 family metallopeptidase n=1 Tax=Cystobacter fuscus TaxID=43 RepID=UPI002B2B84CC|nr:M56 family metallopeptidase [Cystobacter fuscus]